MNPNMKNEPQHKVKTHIHLLILVISALILSACTQGSTTEFPTIQSTKTPLNSSITKTPDSIQIEIHITDSPSPLPTTPEQVAIPQPPSEPIGGIELHAITDPGGLSLLIDTNTYWLRYNGVFWADVENIEGELNWDALSSLETQLQIASEQGYQVILIVRNTPEWARTVPGYNCSPIKPEKLEKFLSKK